MRPAIAIPLGVAGILAAIGTAYGNANGLFAGHPSLAYWFYSASFVMLALSIAGWILSARHSKPFFSLEAFNGEIHASDPAGTSYFFIRMAETR
jgi:hypothetical protein